MKQKPKRTRKFHFRLYSNLYSRVGLIIIIIIIQGRWRFSSLKAEDTIEKTPFFPKGLFGMSEILPEGSTAQDILPLKSTDEGSKRRNWGGLLTGVIGGTLVVLYSVTTPFITPALRKHCLPFVPATSKQIENVLNMLKGRNGSMVDIGSGDGRIVIAAAKVGFKAVGYELNPWLVWYSRYRAWREGVHQDARFYISDLWKVNFAQYTNVVIFGVPQMMLPLEKKLGEELQLDARVIACRFPFPHWSPTCSFGEGIDSVWAYDSDSFRMKKENDTVNSKCILSHPLKFQKSCSDGFEC